MSDTTNTLPEPIKGGSYSRDPVTGELVRLSPEPEAAPAQHQKPEELRATPDAQAPAQQPDQE